VKPAYKQPIDSYTLKEIIRILENNLKVLHPFMPFLTEEIWQFIAERTPEEALIIEKYPTLEDFDNEIILKFDFVTDVISGIRTVRKNKNIPFRDSVELNVINREKSTNQFDDIILKLTNTTKIKEVTEKVEGASFRVKSNEYFVPLAIDNIDVDAELLKLKSELKRAEGFLFGIQKKLSNNKFVENAPEKVILMERKKESDTLAKIKTITLSIQNLINN
jgi:valyl-tRNA synthetase